jgi:hypothetical protein
MDISNNGEPLMIIRPSRVTSSVLILFIVAITLLVFKTNQFWQFDEPNDDWLKANGIVDVEPGHNTLPEATLVLDLDRARGRNAPSSLAANPYLKAVSARWNNFRVEDALALAHSRSIGSLDLSFNRLGDAGAYAFHASGTKELRLDQNGIGDLGAIALASNQNIQVLSLNHNMIDDGGAEALSHNNTIQQLYIGDNNVGNTGASALARNSTIKTLYLDGNEIGDSGAEAFSTNKTLKVLYIANNKITEAGIKHLLHWKRERLLSANPVTVVVSVPRELPVAPVAYEKE